MVPESENQKAPEEAEKTTTKEADVAPESNNEQKAAVSAAAASASALTSRGGGIKKYKLDIISRLGGENMFEFILIALVEALKEDPKLKRFYKTFDSQSLRIHQRTFLLTVFEEHPEDHTQDNIDSVIALRHYTLINQGFSGQHYDMVLNHFVHSMDDSWVGEDVVKDAVCILYPYRRIFATDDENENNRTALLEELIPSNFNRDDDDEDEDVDVQVPLNDNNDDDGDDDQPTKSRLKKKKPTKSKSNEGLEAMKQALHKNNKNNKRGEPKQGDLGKSRKVSTGEGLSKMRMSLGKSLSGEGLAKMKRSLGNVARRLSKDKIVISPKDIADLEEEGKAD